MMTRHMEISRLKIPPHHQMSIFLLTQNEMFILVKLIWHKLVESSIRKTFKNANGYKKPWSKFDLFGVKGKWLNFVFCFLNLIWQRGSWEDKMEKDLQGTKKPTFHFWMNSTEIYPETQTDANDLEN